MAHLKVILAYFWIIPSDFCFISRFSNWALPPDQQTDQPTDRVSYRGAMAHLKTSFVTSENAPRKTCQSFVLVWTYTQEKPWKYPSPFNESHRKIHFSLDFRTVCAEDPSLHQSLVRNSTAALKLRSASTLVGGRVIKVRQIFSSFTSCYLVDS